MPVRNPGFLYWKSEQRRLETENAATAAAAIGTTIAPDVVLAQGTADDALELASLADTKAESANQATAALTAPTKVAMPVFHYTYANNYIIVCDTPSSTIKYRINGGGWLTFSGSPITVNSGSNADAYATASGLTDSDLVTLDRT